VYFALLPTLMAVIPESTRAGFAGSLIVGPLLGVCGMLLMGWRARRAGEIDRRIAAAVLLCWSPFMVFACVVLSSMWNE